MSLRGQGLIFSKFENALLHRRWLSPVILVIFYIFRRLPDVLGASEYFRLMFASFVLYAEKHVFMPNWAINPEFIKTAISPANTFLIYPPGTYLLAFFLRTVSHIFIFYFAAQALVPVLSYFLFLRVTSALTALLLAIVLTQYGTVIQPHPDYMVQPLMLAAMLILSSVIGKGGRSTWGYLIAVGQLAGFVMLFKHNLGVFFDVLCITQIFFNSIEVKKNDGEASLLSRLWLFFILTGYLVFGVFFGTRLIYADEWIYFVLPYLYFWVGVSCFLVKDRLLALDWLACVRSSIIFLVNALIFPFALFMMMGASIGYSRYFYSLFGMGFKHLAAWDLGVVNIVRDYVPFSFNLPWRNPPLVLYLAMMLIFFLLPPLGSLLSTFFALRRPHNLRFLAVASTGIMAGFLLFPLEDFRILQAKLFFFIFPVLMVFSLFEASRPRLKLFLTGFLCLLTVNSVFSGIGSWSKYHAMPTARLTSAWKGVIDIPLFQPVAGEMERQAKVVERAVSEGEYFVLSFSSHEMVPLLFLRPAQAPQYYLDMRESMLDEDVTRDIIDSLSKHKYILVNSTDFDKYLKNQLDGPLNRKILDYAYQNYREVDRYVGGAGTISAISGVNNFRVLKRYNPDRSGRTEPSS